MLATIDDLEAFRNGKYHTPMTTLVWFRNDLRSVDNTALHRAAQNSGELRAIYFATPEQWREHYMAPIRVHYLQRAVTALAQSLAKLGIVLDVLVLPRFADIPQALKAYCKTHGIRELHANSEFLLNEMRRDEAVTAALNIPCHFYLDNLLLEPGTVLTGSGEPYKVFTPFSRSCKTRMQEHPPRCLPRPKPRGDALEPAPIPDFGGTADSSDWPADEDRALKQLRRFCQQKALHYQRDRNDPWLDGSSRLSPLLAIGLLSPRQCFARLQAEQGEKLWDNHHGAGCWFNELLWREFYQHVAWAFPRVVMGRAFKPETDRIRWINNPDHFRAWCEGRTGYPIVDAGMRQLKHSGWMHNRLRMITASFLVKDLHIDWRWGEHYFMAQLIDGDFAANNGGWQWAASTGTDAAPYFRIFNPTTQGQRFDANGDFIRHYVPELAALDNQRIHQPEGVSGYPAPIVDHRMARDFALDMFKAVQN